MNDLCSGNQLIVRKRVTYPWYEKYQGFFMDGLCLGNKPVVRD